MSGFSLSQAGLAVLTSCVCGQLVACLELEGHRAHSHIWSSAGMADGRHRAELLFQSLSLFLLQGFPLHQASHPHIDSSGLPSGESGRCKASRALDLELALPPYSLV